MELNNEYCDDFELYKYYRIALHKLENENQDYFTILNRQSKQLEMISCDMVLNAVKHWKLNDIEGFKRVEKDYFNLRNRKNRCSYRIRYMFDKNFENCYFMTFTFNDETLSKLNADSRRQYVRRYLSKYCSDYIANIDYGLKDNREHYHAIGIIKDLSILMPTEKPKIFNLQYANKGFTSAVKIRDCADYKKLTSYINKITNHAFKDTTSTRVIYSRSFSSDDYYIRMLEYQYLELDEKDLSLNEYINKRTKKYKEIKRLMLKQIKLGR